MEKKTNIPTVSDGDRTFLKAPRLSPESFSCIFFYPSVRKKSVDFHFPRREQFFRYLLAILFFPHLRVGINNLPIFFFI